MLRMVDEQTGREHVLGPSAVGRLIRIAVGGRWEDGRVGLGDVRALLVGDLLRRVLEDLHEAQALLAVIVPDRPAATVRAVVDALMIRPPAGLIGSLPEAAELLGGPIDILLENASQPSPAVPDTPVQVRVGPVTAAADPVSVEELTSTDAAASAGRLALLASPYGQHTTLTAQTLAEAYSLLERTRGAVTEWAQQPSARIPEQTRTALHAAFDDNLDVAAVLVTLRELASDPSVPAGAKFETFVYVDRVLAVDLVRGLAGGPATMSDGQPIDQL